MRSPLRQFLGATLPVLACSLVLFAATESAAVISVGVAPPIIELSVPGGRARSFDLEIYNQGDGALNIKAYMRGLALDSIGVPIPLEEDGRWSCANWITLDRSDFELPPGETGKVRAVIKVPRGVSGGRYAIIVFEATPIVYGRTDMEVALGARVGTIVMESVPRTLVRDGEISRVRVSSAKEDEVRFDVLFRNTGNVHIRADGSLVIRNSAGRIVDRVPLEVDTGTVLPDGVRAFGATWSNPKRMSSGEHSAEVRVNYDGGRAASDSVAFRL
jgi:hypothetical protein